MSAFKIIRGFGFRFFGEIFREGFVLKPMQVAVEKDLSGGVRVTQGGVMEKRPQHPSGRPIRQPKFGVRSIFREPVRGSIIPRLQPEEPRASAIGFTADICARDDDE